MYHILIRHRNHLPVMTLNAISLDALPAIVDLTNGSVATYGTNAQRIDATAQVSWPGDANGDNNIRYVGINNDRSVILNVVGATSPNATANGYTRQDVNLDGVIRYVGLNNDRQLVLGGVGATTPNLTRTGQQP